VLLHFQASRNYDSGMTNRLSPDVASAAISLRASHRAASAREILDLVLRDRTGALGDFGAQLAPATPFALLMAEAIDGIEMMPAWSQWAQADPVLGQMLNERWRDEILPRFAETYGLTGEPLSALARDDSRANRPGGRIAL
jgi:hypothetical protein